MDGFDLRLYMKRVWWLSAHTDVSSFQYMYTVYILTDMLRKYRQGYIMFDIALPILTINGPNAQLCHRQTKTGIRILTRLKGGASYKESFVPMCTSNEYSEPRNQTFIFEYGTWYSYVYTPPPYEQKDDLTFPPYIHARLTVVKRLQ